MQHFKLISKKQGKLSGKSSNNDKYMAFIINN